MAQEDRVLGLVGHAAFKVPVRVATTANITLSGEQTIDGIACVTGDRVLVKDQTTGADNGIWVVDTGSWERADDFDGAYDVVRGTTIFIVEGSTNSSQYWRLATSGTITIGTTSLSFERALVNDSSTVTFTQSGAGAGARTVQAKEREIVSVTDFFANGVSGALVDPSGVLDGVLGEQAAFDSLKQTSAISGTEHRGGGVYYPPGRYRRTGTVTIQNTSSLIVYGMGVGYMLNNTDATTKDATYEGASTILNASSAGVAAFTIVGSDPASSYATSHVMFRDLCVKNLSNTVHGFALDASAAGTQMHDLTFERVTVMGGDRGYDISGADQPFNVFWLNCTMESNIGLSPNHRMNYGIYSDASSAPGVCSVLRDTTIRDVETNHAYFNTSGGSVVTIDNCTLESTISGASIRVAGAGHLKVIGGHWEAIWNTAFWNGTYLQKSSGDATAAAVIEIGVAADNFAQYVDVFAPNANCEPPSNTDPTRCLPFILQHSGFLNIFGGIVGPTGAATIGQPVLRFDGFEVTSEIRGLKLTKAYSGLGALAGGSAVARGIVTRPPDKTLTYGTTIATEATDAETFQIAVTDGVAFTISNPTTPYLVRGITYSIHNGSGGAMGAITWGSEFKLAGAFTNPGNGTRRTISFVRISTEWVEVCRAAADI